MSGIGASVDADRGSALEVFKVFLRLGLTSFGGPVAHLAYYRAEFVERRKWLDEASYADIVALCQFLPGPASTQVAMSIGILRAGLVGAVASWFAFTMPSAIVMVLFAYGVTEIGDLASAPWLHGLKIVAVAVVAQAVWGMARSLTPDRDRLSLAVAAALFVFALPSAFGQIGAIVLGGLIGWRLLPPGAAPVGHTITVPIGRGISIAALTIFFALLVALPFIAAATNDQALRLIDSFYRSGSLVFGGGHVVLPLLQAEVVPPRWVTNDAFLAGYGAAQAVPGPLFTFAAYLGATMEPAPNGWRGATICLVAIFLPSLLLVVGALPFWDVLRRRVDVQSALRGVNSVVVGLLLAALYNPVWTSAIHSVADFAIGVVAFLLLQFWRMPPWIVVVLGALSTAGIARLG